MKNRKQKSVSAKKRGVEKPKAKRPNRLRRIAEVIGLMAGVVLILELALPQKAFATFGSTTAAVIRQTTIEKALDQFAEKLESDLEQRTIDNFDNALANQAQMEIDNAVQGRIENLALSFIPSTYCATSFSGFGMTSNAMSMDAMYNSNAYLNMLTSASQVTPMGAPDTTAYNAHVQAMLKAVNKQGMSTSTCNAMAPAPVDGATVTVDSKQSTRQQSISNDCTQQQRVMQSALLAGYDPAMPISTAAAKTAAGQQYQLGVESYDARQKDANMAIQEATDTGVNEQMKVMKAFILSNPPGSLTKLPEATVLRNLFILDEMRAQLQLAQYSSEMERQRLQAETLGLLDQQYNQTVLRPKAAALKAAVIAQPVR